MPSAPAIAFEWKPSPGWRAARWAVLAVGALCLAWSELELPAKGAIALLAGWLEWRSLRFERLWNGSWWRLDGEGHWSWKRGGGVEGPANLGQSTLLGPLMVLNLRDARDRIDLPIWPDQLDADLRRRLRVRLSQSNAVAGGAARL